ncbi:NLI interacting factor-like phosphatase family protein [Babesia bovis T2Bo]|uniref:Mitochondrial import inner membrane translocase subunit TIM50 n=1 Tax=Babesia bovis TaxID=5865 RepID=A7AQ42_BABBO|nr:NLI interacting factor-like phosphatase family protein [Babesia bovis T2Bo]EDO08676.1 NLI interacting factor-like phosphatase family protein [Babesia bovis T2Bo]|eukprot:XP_001612244.1 NLI interacting factor-like phosphatase family protein [Babesia bovis T2Bo]
MAKTSCPVDLYTNEHGSLDTIRSPGDCIDSPPSCSLENHDDTYMISMETDTTVSDDDLFDGTSMKGVDLLGGHSKSNISAYPDGDSPLNSKECGFGDPMGNPRSAYHSNPDCSYSTVNGGVHDECDGICEVSTLTPTSDNDSFYLDDLDESSDYSDDLEPTDQDSLGITLEGMTGLLSRYIDCTPQLQTTSMRLLISGEAINDSTMIPSQVIRFNRNHFIRYGGLRDHLERNPVFKCMRQVSDFNDRPSDIPTESNRPKVLVVLDLDETLIHMHDRPAEQHDYLVNIVEHEDNGTLPHQQQTNPGVIGFTVHPTMQVSLRPGVLEFFRYLKSNSSRYTVALYTAGTRHYANAILHAIDPDREVIKSSVRFYRDSCEVRPTPTSLFSFRASSLGIGNHHRDDAVPQYYLKKDLSIFGWPLERVVFFDNSLLSFLNNPDNGVWIRPWQGAQPFVNDGRADMLCSTTPNVDDLSKITGQDGLYEFGQIVRLLEECWASDDVRDVLAKKFTLNEVVASVLGTAGNKSVLEALIKT